MVVHFYIVKDKHGFMKKIKFILLIILLGLILYMAIRDTRQGNLEVSKLITKYPLVKLEDNFEGVLKTYTARRGASLIVLENGYMATLNTSRNYALDPVSLDKFLKTGDSLIKNSYSDTLFIYRGNKSYYFIIGEFIDGELN